ncbi:MAG TPA: cupin domain-containing protein [Candidatus Dormibacteraeota bacterium]
MIDETDIRRRLEKEAASCYAWSNGPGTVYGAHTHSYRKVLYCLRGSIRFDLVESGKSIELEPGDRLELPPGTAHAAIVGPGGATCIEGQASLPGA